MPLYVSTQACRGSHLMITQRTLQKTVVLAFDMVFASSVFKRQLGMVVIIVILKHPVVLKVNGRPAI